MRTLNPGQWMTLGAVVAFVLALVAKVLEARADDAADPDSGIRLAQAAGLLRLAGAAAFAVFAVAFHRALSPEPVSAVLALGLLVAAMAGARALDELQSGAVLWDDGTFVSSRAAEGILVGSMAFAAWAPAKRHPAMPRYVPTACLAIGGLAFAGAVASLWADEALLLSGIAASSFLLSGTFLAFQAARLQVRPGGRSGWAMAR